MYQYHGNGVCGQPHHDTLMSKPDQGAVPASGESLPLQFTLKGVTKVRARS
jgi:hypothetical protein